jgi:large subunit ribosomal protein L5
MAIEPRSPFPIPHSAFRIPHWRAATMASRLRERYQTEIAPALMNDFNYANVMEVPRLVKVVVNIGMGEAVQNAKALDSAAADLAAITGQKPVITRAKKSIANFKIRENMPIGMMVTLRGERMYEFLDRFLSVALPRIRDFQGAPANAFDGRGNYSIGVREQLIFPEIEYDKIDRIRGLQVTIVTTSKTDEEARRFLQLLGVPFQRAQALARAG